ncbi:DNA sulfur modification protein DndB [Priestia megaterium]|uniref:DNA sulfur modification protein DndB n=1 Tax=Priestia megaterium TaxID=1404 RepID=UPI00285B4D11|nr:DNA sulfur modification protein DndB [Priestia megaterium]MDR7207642.1 DNA sulfur modification protein DndB [Priestia megaterium]
MAKQLYNEPMQEVEAMLKAKRDHDMKVQQYATLSGIKGKQFGNDIFTTLIKFKDLRTFLDVFPNVQRNTVARKVSKIKTYTISGVTDKSTMRFFPSVTATARGNVFYDESSKQLAIDTQNSKLSLNDGQHRHFGVCEALRELEGRSNKAKDQATRQQINDYIRELEEMVIPLTIFAGLNEIEESQLFYDTNAKAQRPSRSATIRLAQTDYIAKLSRELTEQNMYLKRYGVEMDKMSIQRNNSNFILLTTVYEFIKRLFWSEYKKDIDFLNSKNYGLYKTIVDNTLDMVFKNLPTDLHIKGKYLLEKNYALKGVAKFIHWAKLNKIDDKDIMAAIKSEEWEMDSKHWYNFGGRLSEINGILAFNGGEAGISAVYNSLKNRVEGK